MRITNLRDRGEHRLNFTAIDFETANEQRSSACAIGIVCIEDGLITEQEYHLIKPPGLHFNPFNIAIHGIRRASNRGRSYVCLRLFR